MTTLDTISYIDWSAKILNEHLKTEPKWLATCSKVNRYTRSGKDGKFIICPECNQGAFCLLYTSPSPRDVEESRMPSSA